MDARVKLDRGVLELLDLKGRLPGGGEGNRFDGTARLQLEPLGDLSARVSLTDLALSQLKPLLPAEADPRGRASGTLDWRAPARRVKDLSTWKATGKVRLEDAVAFGFVIDSASGDVAVDKGEVVATNVRAQRKGLGRRRRAGWRWTNSAATPFASRSTAPTWRDCRRSVPTCACREWSAAR